MVISPTPRRCEVVLPSSRMRIRVGPVRASSPSPGPTIETSIMLASICKSSSHEDSRLSYHFMQVWSHDERSLSHSRKGLPMTMPLNTGRSNQKERTRAAIVAAAREAVNSGGEVTMPDVARRALVSEATAYRYFPDLASLLREVLAGVWDSPQRAMEPVADCADPVERIGFAAEVLLREVLAYQGAVRAMIAASITKPPVTALRPGRRFGLIDEALRPLNDTMPVSKPAQFEQLKRGLAVVISAEALFTLTDLCGLTPEAAIATGSHTARSLTMAALAETGSLPVLQVRPLPLLGLLVVGPGLPGGLETGHFGYRHVPPGVARRRGQQRVRLDVHERGPVRRPRLDQGEPELLDRLRAQHVHAEAGGVGRQVDGQIVAVEAA